MLAGDASFRRYYRLTAAGRRAVLMDAPPPMEDVGPYIAVAEILRDLGLSAPEIYAEDRQRGFLLIEDFGDDVYTRLLARGADEDALYALAIDTLVALHRAVAERGRPALPPYDEARLLDEAALLADWYAPSVLGAALPDAARDEYLARWRRVLPLAASARADAGAARLPCRQSDAAARQAGGARLRAARFPGRRVRAGELRSRLAARGCPPRRAGRLRAAMTERYLASFPELDRAAFARSAAILAAQRNCKIIGIFTRLWRRDGKPAYLAHIPRVWRLLEDDLGASRRCARSRTGSTATCRKTLRQRPESGAAAGGSRMIGVPKTAMVLAAGLGTRLRPITDTIPKPLVELGGRTLLDHAIDRLALVGVERVVVNTHYKAEQIEAALAGRSASPHRAVARGGAARNRRRRGAGAAAVSARRSSSSTATCSGSTAGIMRWRGSPPRSIRETMDAVLLFHRTATAVGYEGSGDYFLDPLGTPRRRGEREIAPYLFAGIQLLHRRAFDGIAGPRFSLNLVYAAPRPPAGCTRSCMTANGTTSAPRTGWP